MKYYRNKLVFNDSTLRQRRSYPQSATQHLSQPFIDLPQFD